MIVPDCLAHKYMPYTIARVAIIDIIDVKKYFKNCFIKAPIPRQERETKINVQRREKLANTLTENFVKKFNTPTNRGLIHNEVSTLLKRERLNEHDLKTFETELHRKLNVKKNKENLKSNLITNLKSKNQNSVTDIKENITDRKFKYITFFWIIIATQFVIGSNLQTKGYSIRNSKSKKTK